MSQSESCTACPLRKTGAFANNNSEEVGFIQGFKRNQMELQAGELLIREGARSSDLYTLLSGWAFRYRTLSDGQRQILNFLLPGDFIGLQEKLGSEFTSGVEILTAARVCCFPNNKLWDLYRGYPALAYDVTWLAAHEELIVDENLISVGRRTAMQRIAMLLLHLYKRMQSINLSDDQGFVPFPLKQHHMADALGLSLVHVNKTMRRLRQLGMYQFRSGKLRLLDLSKLEELADYYVRPVPGRPLI